MQRPRLGPCGLKASRIAFGTMGFGDGSREMRPLGTLREPTYF